MDDLIAFVSARLEQDERPVVTARMRREIAAKRAILAEAGRIAQSASMYPNQGNAAALIAMQTVLKILAAIYIDYPEYRQEWKP